MDRGGTEAEGGDTCAESGDARGGEGGDAKAIGGDADAWNVADALEHDERGEEDCSSYQTDQAKASRRGRPPGGAAAPPGPPRR